MPTGATPLEVAAARASRRRGLLVLTIVILAWGSIWPVHKVILERVPPIWLVALRSAVATGAMLAVAGLRRRFVVPPRGDLPIVLSIALLHMVGFVLLVSWGLQRVSTGRSVVLAYTMALWVMPGARLFLGEPLTPRRIVGVGAGMLGLTILFNPLAFDWSDRSALLGNAAVLGGALLWGANIVHIRGHRWRSTPFELVPWELAIATLIVTPVAALSHSLPSIAWDVGLVGLVVYSGVVGVAIGYWAAATAGRLLPAVTRRWGSLPLRS